MKIKTNDWLGVRFSSRQSEMRLKVFNEMYAASTTSGGKVLDAEMLAQRRDVVYRLNTDAKEWNHYLFTDKALNLSRTISIDQARFNWAMLRGLHNKPRPKDACYLSGPNEFFRWFLFNEGVAIMHLKADHATRQVNRYTYSLGFDLTTSPGLEASRAEVWPSAERFLQLLVFTELTDVDILEVAAGQKSNNNRAPLGERVTNQTDVALIRVHAHWNTVVVNTSIIGVRGFKRNQPYGPRHLGQTKEIYIDPHTRNGYTRNAKTSS